ncbi:MAG: DUF3781 domain-containing protein [Candidatus Cloacimonetes bacterium]|nr:DUF3781 domain-containing protein [Candidatus Cloacimonadota bacterium]
MENFDYLVRNLEKIHTTENGIMRIQRNLDLYQTDVVEWCKEKISDKRSTIIKKGKNYYLTIDSIVITINAHSLTIITAHKRKPEALLRIV